MRSRKKKKKKKKKKKHKNNNNNLQTGRTNTLLCRRFLLFSREKSATSMWYLKNLHQSVPYVQNEPCLAYK